ncbi:unnamed protein product [Ectocarpus sp. 13 AM-2016]
MGIAIGTLHRFFKIRLHNKTILLLRLHTFPNARINTSFQQRSHGACPHATEKCLFEPRRRWRLGNISACTQTRRVLCQAINILNAGLFVINRALIHFDNPRRLDLQQVLPHDLKRRTATL